MEAGGRASDGRTLAQRARAARERLEGLMDLLRQIEPALRERPAALEVAGILEELSVISEDLCQQNWALAEETRRYQALFDLAPEPYLTTDPEGIIQRANRAAAELFSISQKELVGRPLALFVAEDGKQQFYSQLTSLAEQEQRVRWRTTLRRRRVSRRDAPDDARLSVEADVSANAVRDESGGLTALQWMIHPTDGGESWTPERVAQELSRPDERLTLINRVGRELSATLDVGAVAERLLREVTSVIGAEGASVWLWDGRQEGSLVCQAVYHVGEALSPRGLCVAPDEGIASWAAHEGESVVVNATAEDERFSGTIDEQTGLSTDSLIAVPLRVRGKILGVVEVVNKRQGSFDGEDLFLIETLAASAAVAIDNAELVHQLEVRNHDLQAFGHTVAHDIKNSLGLVVGYADTLSESVADLSYEELVRYLGIIRKHGDKAALVVDELLFLAELSDSEVTREPLDMDGVVADVEDRLEELIERNGASIVAPEAWPEALGYGPWIEEVWTNYVTNALRHGGDHPQIELGADRDGHMVRFWVRDNGPGLSPEAQEGLFAPFAKRSLRSDSHGLGLSIVKRIVEKLGGEVGVESAAGEGASFWFTLSAASESGEQAEIT